MSRLITVAAKEGGGDPDANPTLRTAIQKAKDANMPKENIERAVKKGTGELEGTQYHRSVYEGYGPEGGAFLLQCLTDNTNRTVAEIRHLFERYEGSLGEKGSTAYIFNQDDKSASFEIEVEDKQKIKKIKKLIDEFEDHDDVQEVFHNYKFLTKD